MGLFSLSLVAPLTQAAPGSDAYTSSISIYASRSDHTFTEYNDKNLVLNRELGAIDHLGVALHWQLDSGMFLEVKSERGKGSVQYRGFDQALQYIEHRTEYVLTEQQLRLGRQFGNTEAYVGVGSHYRERNIVGGNLYEEFDWHFASCGLAKWFDLSQRWQAKLFAEAELALDSQLKAEFAGHFDPVVVAPGRITSTTAGVELLFNATPKFTISLAPIYNFTLIKPGDDYTLSKQGSEIGTASLPKSEYETISWQLKLSKLF